MLCIVGGGIQVGGDGGGVETGDGFDNCVLAGKLAGAAAVGAEAGKQVGRDDDESLRRQFIGHLLGPVGQAEDLVNENDDGGFVLDLGVDDEGLHGAVVVLEGRPTRGGEAMHPAGTWPSPARGWKRQRVEAA